MFCYCAARQGSGYGVGTDGNKSCGCRFRSILFDVLVESATHAEGDTTMRFMMLMIPKDYEKAQPGAVPSAEAVAVMMKYNESLQKAGVLLALDGLQPPSMGARVSFAGGKPIVTDGPFAEAKEV